MKKFKSTMAAVAQLATPENITGKKRDSTDNGQKKHGIFKGIKKILMPTKKAQPQTMPETKKEPTVEDIKEQIEKNQLLEASENLLELEHKILKDPLLQDKAEELESLYKELERAVFKVIKDSITETNGELLSQAVNVIVEQEKEDAQCASDKDSTNGCSRPKEWKKKWEGYVKLTVCERIGNLSQVTTNELSSTSSSFSSSSSSSSSSSVSQNLLTVGKTLKKDLIHVVTHLKEHYPKDFDVCNAYAQNYHWFLIGQIEPLTEFELGGEDTYYLLCWVQNFYPNMILKDPRLIGHIDESSLNNLISSHTIRLMEVNYIGYEMDSVRTYMKRGLDMEVERWKSGKEPEKLGKFHHSELHIDILQIYSGAIKRAEEIQKEMVEKVSGLLPNAMKNFFKMYKTVLEDFLEKNKAHSFYREICITSLNCCFYFREFIEKKDGRFDPQQQMMSTVLQCEDLLYAALFQELYQALKVQFKKMSQGGALCSYQTMQDIIKITEKSVSGFEALCTPCYKDMIGRIQKHLVMEYLTRLLKRKVSHKSVLQLQTLANQINESANLINDFFDAHQSEQEWLKPVIPKVAEIIRLQDLSAIQLEVATLVEEYPDIRKKQIEAILYIKATLTRHDIKYILKVAETVERRTSSKPKLFELIKDQ
ncbi:tumor necrosis factor alpha-induced protein 2 [Dendropsophus ebraccatus]|uniref:tumor necrosis factor alpha-induced protein 2 n=1 Tax=Dendropsophus ebraccatus TaxID=150705 RepID=UPI00383106E9